MIIQKTQRFLTLNYIKMNNRKKKIIIIGATSGIGEGLARLYHKKGYIVGVTGRRLDNLED